MITTKTLNERFWDKVDKTEGCWLWMASLCGHGYGAFVLRRGKHMQAHRFSWMIHNGPIPKGMCVCHHCDNPRCVNPEHLFIGTVKDNTQDMIKKGRKAPCNGENNGRAKLTIDQVLYARDMYFIKRISHRAIAKMMGISQSAMYDAIKGRHWKNLENRTKQGG